VPLSAAQTVDRDSMLLLLFPLLFPLLLLLLKLLELLVQGLQQPYPFLHHIRATVTN
jgi:hypothetical protein